MTIFLQQVFNGLTLGSIYGLVALGLTLVYGILHIPNFAHGALYMVGAFMSYFFMVDMGAHYWVAMAGSAVVVAVLGVICERLVFHPLRNSPPIHDKIAAIGILLFLEAVVHLFWGSDFRRMSTPFGGVVNLDGVFYGMRYQVPAMKAAGGGSIVNMASILGQVGFRNSAAYVAAKHGLVGLTKSAALEHAPDRIRVNAVGPGFIKTPLIENSLDAEMLDALVDMHPLGRLGEADEVAELVLWLASEKASFVTGSYYPVDGGYLAQ